MRKFEAVELKRKHWTCPITTHTASEIPWFSSAKKSAKLVHKPVRQDSQPMHIPNLQQSRSGIYLEKDIGVYA